MWTSVSKSQNLMSNLPLWRPHTLVFQVNDTAEVLLRDEAPCHCFLGSNNHLANRVLACARCSHMRPSQDLHIILRNRQSMSHGRRWHFKYVWVQRVRPHREPLGIRSLGGVFPFTVVTLTFSFQEEEKHRTFERKRTYQMQQKV